MKKKIDKKKVERERERLIKGSCWNFLLVQAQQKREIHGQDNARELAVLQLILSMLKG